MKTGNPIFQVPGKVLVKLSDPGAALLFTSKSTAVVQKTPLLDRVTGPLGTSGAVLTNLQTCTREDLVGKSRKTGVL